MQDVITICFLAIIAGELAYICYQLTPQGITEWRTFLKKRQKGDRDASLPPASARSLGHLIVDQACLARLNHQLSEDRSATADDDGRQNLREVS